MPEIDPKIALKIPTITVPEIDVTAFKRDPSDDEPGSDDDQGRPPENYAPRHGRRPPVQPPPPAPQAQPPQAQPSQRQAPPPAPPSAPPRPQAAQPWTSPQAQPPQAYRSAPAQPHPQAQPQSQPQSQPQTQPTGYRPTPNYGPQPPVFDEYSLGREYQAKAEARAGAGYQSRYPAPDVEVPAGKKRKKGRVALFAVIIVLVLLGGTAAGQLLRPLPEPSMRLTLPNTSHTFPGAKPVLPMPMRGQSALYVEGIGRMAASGGSSPTPTASVAKVMTAYVFLRSHPLASGRPGPTYTVSPQAAAQIPARKQRGESLLDVKAGMRLTQRKALEALMVISANDVAHELARWDAGNPQAFVRKMNRTARELGMTRTRYTDPSGYHSGTVSTAADQVKLLRAAMAIPAFREIVAKRSYVPDDGGQPRMSGNVLLGQYGVMGGKTGFTDAAGGNFVFAARTRVGGSNVTLLGAVMGQRSPSAMGALEASRDLLAVAEKSLTSVTLVRTGTQVGQISDGLGGITPVKAGSPITLVGWPGLTVRIGMEGNAPHTGAQGTRIGTVKAGTSGFPLVLGRELKEPSYYKRLARLG